MGSVYNRPKWFLDIKDEIEYFIRATILVAQNCGALCIKTGTFKQKIKNSIKQLSRDYF